MLISLLMLTALAAPPELRPAMVDWSGVSEATVRRCNLGLLQSLLLQGMVESGFAVVDSLGPRVIEVTLSERKGAIAVEARRDGVFARRRVPVPTRCDSTIGVELQAAARATASEVEQQTRVAAPESVAAPPTAPLWADAPRVVTVPDDAPPESTTRAWTSPRGRIGLGAAMTSVESPFAAVTGQLGVRYGGWLMAAAVDVAVRDGLGVIVLEPAVGPEVSRFARLGVAEVSLGFAVQLLGHTFWRDGDRGGHLDVRFAAPLRLEHASSGLGLALVPSFRLRPVEHRVGDELAYRARHLGGLVALTFRLPP